MTAPIRQPRRDRHARFSQRDVTRALRGALAAGVSVQAVTVDREGRIVVTIGAPAGVVSALDNPLDRWRAQRDAG